MSTETVPVQPRPLYARLWAGVPRELGFLLPGLPLGIVALALLSALFSAGMGTLVLVIGVFLVVGALYVARGFAMTERARLRLAGAPAGPEPDWRAPARGNGFWARLLGPVVNIHYWLALLHGIVVNFALVTITWSITVAWVAVALGGTLWWLAAGFIPDGDRDWNLLEVIVGAIVPGSDPDLGIENELGDIVVLVVAGLIALVTLPFVTHGLTLAHQGLARLMLSSLRSERLEQQVAGLSASRTAAVAAEGTALRRLERDIHDGPQQRLVRLQMDLAAADRQLEDDPQRARKLLAEAMQQSRDALEELRALSRGFAPPILLDRGLVAALESAADRSPIPVRILDELPEGVELPQELERNLYFVAAELLTNAAKHSGASDIELALRMLRVPDGDDTWVELRVTDDGRGGAALRAGHGLAGLEERLWGLGGSLVVQSPRGGPTTVTAVTPLTSTLGPSLRS